MGKSRPGRIPCAGWKDFAHPQTARQVYNQDFHLIDITVLPDDTIMQHRRVAMLELLQKHIRQRDMMELQEQLASLLALGYTSRRQLRTLLHYLLQAGNACRSGRPFYVILRKMSQTAA